MMSHFFGGRSQRYREYEVKGLGSGYIISPDGYILTNHHVAGNAAKIIISMTNGKKYEAKIVGADMVSDVCLLKIEADEKLPYLKLANSDNIEVGEWVLAFGNPFGLFDKNSKPTVTLGIVSNNCVSFLEEDRPHNRVYKNMIQTDAAISSGNSGGPLVNADGEVIGMNTMIWSTSQSAQGAGSIGIGFAIPINRVKKIVDLLRKDGTIDRDFQQPMEVREMDARIANYLKTELREAVIVFGFKSKSDAEKAGIELGDIITEVNGYKIVDAEDYNIALGDAVRGDKIEFTLLRDDKILKKTLTMK
jgi:serine protease Do